MKPKFTGAALAAVLVLALDSARATDPYQPDIPESLAAQVSHARGARLNNNPGDAVRELEGVVQSHPKYFLAHYELGLAYEAVKRVADAIAQLEAAKRLNIELKLGEPTIENSLGALYLSAARYKDAVAELEIASSPSNIHKLEPAARRVVFNNLGLAYSRVDRGCEAAVAYDIANKVSEAPSMPMNQEDASGVWILTTWVEKSPSIDPDKTQVTGWLNVSPGRTSESNGDLTLCVKPPQRRSAYVVRERLVITIRGADVRMAGRVSDGALVWQNDQIKASRSDTTITGTAQSGSSDIYNIQFEKLW